MIKITDSESNISFLKYIEESLLQNVKSLGGEMNLIVENERSVLKINANLCEKYLISTVEEKIAEVIAVGYKYKFFQKHLRVQGLGCLENEILLSSLIAADIDEDKRYIKNKIKKSEIYQIDGSFDFLMKPLLSKWQEVISYIPPVFSNYQLKEFVRYLIKEKSGRRVYVENGSVYDRHFNRLTLTKLTQPFFENRVLREVILSSSGEVELTSKIDKTDELYLKEFFGDKIFFANSFFT